MIASSTRKKSIRKATGPETQDPSSELKIISELGRSLLFTVHPKKVAQRVADSVQAGIGVQMVAFGAELENIGLISCAFAASGEQNSDFLFKDRFEHWLSFLPPQ